MTSRGQDEEAGKPPNIILRPRVLLSLLMASLSPTDAGAHAGL